MSCLRDPNYVREFAYRTKLNYYRNMFLYGDNKMEYQEKIKDLEEQMRKEGYVIDPYFEVTHLLNSVIGMLIFPEQNLYEGLPTDRESLERDFPNLFECTQSEYINTYTQTSWENKYSPQSIIRHIRNAFSHDRVMIFPKNKKDENKISKIVIQDCKVRKNVNEEIAKELNKKLKNHFGDVRDLDIVESEVELFSIEIPIKVLENVFMEICDYALRSSR